MKALPLILSGLTLMATATPAVAVHNLDGTWCIQQDSIDSEGNQTSANVQVDIDMLAGEQLFHGGVVSPDPDPPGTNFSGVVKGRSVYITHWDSVTTAQLNLLGTRMRGVNQAFYADRTSKTTLVVATRGACPGP